MPPRTPTPDAAPAVPLSPLAPKAPAGASSDIPAVKGWSHPFGAKSDAIQQLLTLANAQAGYFPLGRNGMWHGAVHFDSGTAGTVGPEGQSHVRCLADGEVVAYRISEHTPITKYFPGPGVTVDAPFASGFVLVRHRLEAPRIEGDAGTPPSLVFYSLYMHLADWASYQADSGKARPGFWPESDVRRVKSSTTDLRHGHPEQQGLNLRHLPSHGKVIGFLQQGAPVSVSGEGAYRKVESVKGPVDLQNTDGSLQGYINFAVLQAVGDGVYRVNTQHDDLPVRAEPSASSDSLFKLPKGTEVTLSGEGTFRKLESVTQYVHFASLESERVPECGRVVVLEQPVPIKAGELIGHLGPYQECDETAPQEKLHLEVFACQNVETFFTASRDWATRLPDNAKTWLKLEKGTKVVSHQEHYSQASPPHPLHPHEESDAQLLVPRALLDGLPAERKIAVPRQDGKNACNWYRLDGLLNDPAGNLLKGWVCEEVGVTPWVNPWSWDGYAVIYNYDPPHAALAYFLTTLTDFYSDEELSLHRPLIDASDKGPVRERLFDILKTDRAEKITADDVQAALKIPARAQSLSQLVIYYESEWNYRQQKWDALDKVLGHSNSAPILNWVAEKERIKQVSWWSEVAEKLGLPVSGKVFHIHPIGLMANFGKSIYRFINIEKFINEYNKEHRSLFGWFEGGVHAPLSHDLNKESESNLRNLLIMIERLWGDYFEEHNDVYLAYMLATIRLESYDWHKLNFFGPICESISYAQAEIDYGSGPTGRRIEMARSNHNTALGDGFKYRGRGLVQVPWKINYEAFSNALGVDFVNYPDRALDLENTTRIMISGMRDGIFVHGQSLSTYLSPGRKDYYNARRTINGTDKADVIKFYAQKFEDLISRCKQ